MTTQRAQTMTRPTNRLEHDDTGQWWEQAACNGKWGVFDQAPEAAADFCKACPVTSQCLTDALKLGDFHLTRGGYTPGELVAISRGEKPARKFPTGAEERLAWVKDRILEGLSRKEIAHAAQITTGTLDSYMTRARRELGIKAQPKIAECGTQAGYARHVTMKTSKCQPCRDAHNEYKKQSTRRIKAAS